MTTKLLNEEVASQVQEAFNQLQEPVEVLFFGEKEGCEYCDDTRQLVEEVQFYEYSFDKSGQIIPVLEDLTKGYSLKDSKD